MSLRPIPGLQLESQPDDVLIRCCLWAEARGESDLGMLGVLYVIAHRALKHGVSMGRVILQPWQFSSFNANDPNRDKMLDAWEHDVAGWARADSVANRYKALETSDPTEGATHYCTLALWGRDDSGRIAQGKPPAWHSKQEIEAGRTVATVTIGHHQFARAA